MLQREPITWEEPPARSQRLRSRPPIDHTWVAYQLRLRPRKWGRVTSDGHRTLDKSIRTAVVAAYRPGGTYEAITLEMPNGRFATWARYLGAAD